MVNVSVDTCLPMYSLEVLQLQFEGGCTSWNCSVNSTNDDRLFLVNTGRRSGVFMLNFITHMQQNRT